MRRLGHRISGQIPSPDCQLKMAPIFSIMWPNANKTGKAKIAYPRWIQLIGITLLMLALPANADQAPVLAVPNDPASALKLPAGFKAKVFARLQPAAEDYFRGPRMLAFDAAGTLYVSTARDGQLLMLPDADQDGLADSIQVIADRLNAPHGLVFVADKLLIANQDSVLQLERQAGRWSDKPVTLIRDLPTGGHASKTLKLGPDGYLYLNVGSSCNVCAEQDPLRATILRYTVDGQPAGAVTTLGRHRPTALWASGLRNSQSFDWHPMTQAMFATNNGADQRADSKGGRANDDIPPEHLNHIEAGKHYGWPHCWGIATGKLREDPNFPANSGYCQAAQGPALLLPAHSTPIGITFLGKAKVPQAWQQDALIALHGSWNRQQPEGYKIIRVRFESRALPDGKTDWQPVAYEDFTTGWLSAKGAWGRPVDIAVSPSGDIYISDDRSGLIFRIRYGSTE